MHRVASFAVNSFLSYLLKLHKKEIKYGLVKKTACGMQEYDK